MRFLILSLFLIPVIAKAEVTATATLASNYIWRGQSFTNNLPATQGSIDFIHNSGANAGVWVSNTVSASGANDSETDLYLGYTQPFGEFNIGAALFWYTYMLESKSNAVEYLASISYKIAKLEVSLLPKYFEKDSNSAYAKLSLKQPIESKLSLIGHVGFNSFSDEANIGFKNYLDYKLGLSYNVETYTLEIVHTDTNRKDLSDTDLRDEKMLITLSKTF